MLTRMLACSLALAGLVAAAPLVQAQDTDARGHAHPYYWFQADNADVLPFSPDRLEQFWTPVEPGEYYLGLSLGPVGETLCSHLRLDDDQGVVVMSVLDESSAQEAGLEKHDVLTQIDGVKVTGHQMLVDAIQEAGSEEREVELSYIRAGEHASLSLKPMQREDFESRKADPKQGRSSRKVGPDQIERLPKEFRHFFRSELQGDNDFQSQLDELRQQIEEMKEMIEKSVPK